MTIRYRKVSAVPILEAIEASRYSRPGTPWGSKPLPPVSEFPRRFGLTYRTYLRLKKDPMVTIRMAEDFADATGEYVSTIFPDYDEEVLLGRHYLRPKET